MPRGDDRESTGVWVPAYSLIKASSTLPASSPTTCSIVPFVGWLNSTISALLSMIASLAFLYKRDRDKPVPNRVLIKWDPTRDKIDELVAAVKALCAGRPSTILTRRGSPLAAQIRGELGTRGKVIYLKQGVSYPTTAGNALLAAPTTPHVISLIRKARIEFGEPIAVVIDSLTDLAMILGTKKAYELVREMLDSLEVDDRVAAIIVGGAQGEREEMLFRSLFPNEFPTSKFK